MSLPTPPPSLLDTCCASVLDGTYDVNRLEALPATLLVQLLQACVADKLEAQAQHASSAAQMAAILEGRYLIDPPSFQDRVGSEMYERVEGVVAKWEPQPCANDMSSHHNYMNEGKHLGYSKSKKCFELLRREKFAPPLRSDYADVHEVMSSALLLYRLCCLFVAQVEVNGPAGYKRVWSVQLKHRATGEAVGFSEWKGGALVRVSHLDGPPEFEANMVELLNLLYDEHCLHPYDGCVAGSVA